MDVRNFVQLILVGELGTQIGGATSIAQVEAIRND